MGACAAATAALQGPRQSGRQACAAVIIEGEPGRGRQPDEARTERDDRCRYREQRQQQGLRYPRCPVAEPCECTLHQRGQDHATGDRRGGAAAQFRRLLPGLAEGAGSSVGSELPPGRSVAIDEEQRADADHRMEGPVARAQEDGGEHAADDVGRAGTGAGSCAGVFKGSSAGGQRGRNSCQVTEAAIALIAHSTTPQPMSIATMLPGQWRSVAQLVRP